MFSDDQIGKILGDLDDLQLTTVNGRITEIVGMLIKAVVPQVKIGEICMIKRTGTPLLAEVVGFTKEEVLLSPLGEMTGIGPSSEVIPTYLPLHIKVGPQLLGRILNGLGEPLDVETKGPLVLEETCPVYAAPPDPVKRMPIDKPISTGVRALDGVLTAGLGQRVGIFAASSATEAPKHGMNQERMKGSQAKPFSVRVTMTASGTRSAGRRGKIMRPPGRNASSHPAGGATTPALT